MAQPHVRFLLRARPRHDVTGLTRTIALADPILTGLGYRRRARRHNRDRRSRRPRRSIARHCSRPAARGVCELPPVGGKRDVQRLALARTASRCAAAGRRDRAACRAHHSARSKSNAEGCTLCLACVSACPTGAMSADPERPMLKFTEDACVQCGLCAATCPEKVITLKPQLDFRAATAAPRIMKQEEPFECIRCSKPFGVKSTIERVTAKLEGKHWMFKGHAERLERPEDVRGLPRRRGDRAGLRSVWRRHSRAAQAAHRRRLSARGGGEGARVITLVPRAQSQHVRSDVMLRRAGTHVRPRQMPRLCSASLARRTASGARYHHFPAVAFFRNSISALRSSAEPMVCSGILVPGV